MQTWSLLDTLWATLVFLGGLLMWATQVGPKQVISHAAEWATTFGVKHPPAWLESKNADRVLRHIGALIAVVFFLVWLFQYFDVGGMPLKTKVLFWVCAIGAVCAIAFNFFELDKRFSLHPTQIIFIGALVVLVGVVWQWRRAVPIDPRVTTLEAQVKILTDQLAAKPATLAPPVIEPAKPTQAERVRSLKEKYPPDQIAKMKTAVGQLYDVLNDGTPAIEAADDAYGALNTQYFWHEALIKRGGAPRLGQAANSVLAIITKKTEILSKLGFSKDEIAPLVADPEGRTELFAKALESLASNIEMLRTIPEENLNRQQLLLPHYDGMRMAKHRFGEWLDSSLRALKQKNDDLDK